MQQQDHCRRGLACVVVLSSDITDFQNSNSQPTRHGRSWAVVDGQVEFLSIQVCDGIIFRKNLNVSKPSNYQSKGLGGNNGCRDKNST